MAEIIPIFTQLALIFLSISCLIGVYQINILKKEVSKIKKKLNV